jgi:aldose 1-epimerase
MFRSSALFLASALLFLFSTSLNAKEAGRIQVAPFGKTKDGDPVSSFKLTNQKGMEAEVISFGAALVSLKVPDRNGKLADIVLGYDDLAGYVNDKDFFGATIGRYGNRIAAGKFDLDGVTYNLPKNNGPNTLHGGTIGFNKHVWTGTDLSSSEAQVLQLTYTSPDGDQGFPGNLKVTVTYTLPRDRNELRIDYLATTDKDTVVNLTNHSYFNLTGSPTQEIVNHQLTLHALQYTPVDATLIPTGEVRSVNGNPFDFRKSTAIGARINQDDEQLKFGKGYDHNWVLETPATPGHLHPAAEVFEPTSGRVLEVLTTEPGIQFYSGNFLDGTVKGKGGQLYAHRTGFCLETQHFPDSPNHPNFPSTTLKPGQTYRSTTVFRFSTRK